MVGLIENLTVELVISHVEFRVNTIPQGTGKFLVRPGFGLM
jgi:hypothetical protein